MSATPPNKMYRTIDLDSYLDSVEDAVRSGDYGNGNGSGGDGGGNDNGSGDGKISMRAKEEHRRVMIRTLLSIPSRTEFDRLLRDARNEADFHVWKKFVLDELDPALAADDGKGEAILRDKNPNFRSAREDALEYDWKRGNVARRFARMASGPAYRGDLAALLRDAALSAMSAYEEALEGPLEVEVTATVIQGRSGVDDSRKEAALKCLGMDLSPGGGMGNAKTQAAGEKCERECAGFLRTAVEGSSDADSDGERPRLLVLENVFVKQTRKGKSFDVLRAEWERSADDGVIISKEDRHCITSEFDAVVVDTSEDRVAEIWESKHTVGPCTISDALAKKLTSLRSLLEEEEVVVLYRGGTATLSRSPLTSTSTSLGAVPKFKFGIFGRDIQSPAHAASQLRAVACQELLHRDVDAVLQTVETGTIEVDVDDVIDKVEQLRSVMKEAELDAGFDIQVVVANGRPPSTSSS